MQLLKVFLQCITMSQVEHWGPAFNYKFKGLNNESLLSTQVFKCVLLVFLRFPTLL